MNMKKIATALVVALVPLLALPLSDVRAQYYDQQRLAKIDAVKVIVIDGVVDGCLPRPGVLKTEAELILRRSDIFVSNNAEHTLEIVAAGNVIPETSSTSALCVAVIKATLYSFEALLDLTRSKTIAAESGGVAYSGKAKFQNHLRQVINEFVTELANEILKARANASTKSQ